MLSSLLPLVALAISAAASPAVAPLTMAVSGSAESVITTLTNTGKTTMTLLNDPRGALSKFPYKTFNVVHENGDDARFIGAMVKYVPQTAINMNSTRSFTILAPGQSVSVTHDLSKAYDFSSTGAGAYTMTPSTSFYQVVDGAAVPVEAALVSKHVAQLTTVPKAAVVEPTKTMKRATYIGCSSNYQSQLVSAASAAQSYAASAYSYTSSHTASTARFTTWFGTYTSAHHTTVNSHFSNLNAGSYSSFTYDCSTCTESDVYAYVYPDQYGKVYLCGVFWQSPTKGTDSQGGTLIHESSHFTKNGGTQDNAYGQSACKSLAKSNSNQAVANADSHEYFAENNPALS